MDADERNAIREWFRVQGERSQGRLSGAEFEAAEADLDHRILDLVLAKAEKLWDREEARDWLVRPNSHLAGSRPLNVMRVEGPARVFDVLESGGQIATR